ncbi:Crp/Fnr family transcriptional regulator [Sphingobacterium litopenaei]|uniref:Crp/Fnr family transcriptional regulator n=1 Tax=Sphingobacterium litopenaei TaxID=2763500 RepID=A0ABR7YC84_9SPHI|nr:Crp/Fnr family transcriptional regulator [Sphingobacterium litopenaei]MBD1428899.1 Crp/Fnr family transcriptional regulator [Sphingobacterium litopenaei]
MGWGKIKFAEMELKRGLLDIFPLQDDEMEKIIGLAEKVTLSKNEILIQQQQVIKYIYFLEEGICRIFYPKEEKEVVLDFCFPGDIILPLNSYIHNLPTYEIVDTLEDCTVYRISIAELQSLYSTSLPIANWGRKLAELETLKIESRLMQSLFKSAAERYADLLGKAPKLLQRIKLGYIASYLGVSQVTLSRIRAEIR